MKRFINDFKRYWPYINYSAICDLKSEVADSYLNWLWWIIEPICFMLIYVFIGNVVFRKSEPYFPVFVFIGITLWNFFSKTITASTTLVKSNKNIIKKVYIPCFMLVIERMLANFYKMCISFVLIIIFMLFYRVPFSFNVLYLLPLIIIIVLISFGLGTILLHFGVFMDDLSNLITVILRLLMYMSGIFYSISNRVPTPFNKYLLLLNPIAYSIDATREALLYLNSPNILTITVWFLIGIIISTFGIGLVYHYENSYAKVN
ncbi:MAG TPA: ABC transporter permease [Bacillales bacterium]|jgi:ABC-type polysaccharide/polyol phosphate export permease|nr:ABC transporter permease [Bacillales bacterium]